ncbi:MAG: glycosyltransferase family 2 protein [Moorea sp. SIOASIH]|uniref:glycosyltransferase family 2 protein n=1 Tax=Moorena sp. SIOASIH TaxID=2607817 RepID=UPI0013BB9495|nr:glycosyltransferase family 2 protein [Moorena sp. SIOASIH]NEO37437.1 glycosyltransferase family 2 protein [Moorena sp. SIOASIH]
MTQISLIIPVRNRQHYTQTILSQIFQQLPKVNTDNTSVISVIIVDDGSTDGTRDMIRRQFPNVYLIEGDGNLWWTGGICLGMNYAIDKLDSDYLVWLNDDISLSDNFLNNLIDSCQSPLYNNTIVGGIVRDKTYSDWIVFSGMDKKQPIRSMDYFATAEARSVDTLNGNIAIIPRVVVDKIGFPDADRFRHYGGDFEFVSRANKSGFNVILSSKLQATTDYNLNDLIRYMPPLLQWYLQPNTAKRLKILKGFTNLKSNYNIWHMVNLIDQDSQHVPFWRYAMLYVRQVIKLLVSDFLLKSKTETTLKTYLKQQNAPEETIKGLMNYRIKLQN